MLLLIKPTQHGVRSGINMPRSDCEDWKASCELRKTQV